MSYTSRHVDNALVRFPQETADVAANYVLRADGAWVDLLGPTLTAMSSLSTGADRIAYSTGTDTFAETDFTAQARTLVGSATRREMAEVLGVPWILEQSTEGSAVGASSTAYHSMWNYTIPGDSLGTNGRAVVEFEIEVAVAAGSTGGQFLVGGTVVWQASGNSLTAGTGTPFHVIGRAVLPNNGATNQQRGYWEAQVTNDSTATSSVGTAYGGWLFNQNKGAGTFGDSTQDTRSDFSFEFKMKFNSSDASNYMQLRSARCLIEPTV